MSEKPNWPSSPEKIDQRLQSLDDKFMPMRGAFYEKLGVTAAELKGSMENQELTYTAKGDDGTIVEIKFKLQ